MSEAEIKMSVLTPEILRSLLSYDPETGIFTNKVTRSRLALAGNEAGTINNYGYRQICLCGKLFKSHRLAWLYVYGTWPQGQIDHINGVRTDNRICNLRDVKPQENIENQRRPRSNNSTGFLGVRSDRLGKKFVAHIGAKKKFYYLGVFETAKEAHDAYLQAKRKLHAGCTI